MKQCKTGRKLKKKSEFNRHKTNSDHLQAYCRKCQREYGKKWLEENGDKNIVYCRRYYKENKQKWREREYKKKYNMTLQEFDALLLSQNNKCPICDTALKSTRQMHVDHHHESGMRRQILCSKCNTALGLLNENVVNFEKAIQYINKWNKICVQRS